MGLSEDEYRREDEEAFASGDSSRLLPYSAGLRDALAANPRFEVAIAVLVLASCLLFAVETLPGLSPLANTALILSEDAATAVFVQLAACSLQLAAGRLSLQLVR